MASGLEKRIFAVLRGGLGNQLFQITAYRAIAKHQNKKLIVDTSSYLHPGQRKLGRKLEIGGYLQSAGGIEYAHLRYLHPRFVSFFALFLRKLIDRTHLDRPIFGFWGSEENDSIPSRYVEGNSLRYVDGYFAKALGTDLYSSSYAHTLNWLRTQQRLYFGTIPEKDPASVAIHIRRGDLPEEEKNLITPGKINELFAEFAISREKVVIFSDCPEDTALEFSEFEAESVVYAPKGLTPLESLLFLSTFKTLICSYSTFSWWAAFLAHSQNSEIFFPRLKPENCIDNMYVPWSWRRF